MKKILFTGGGSAGHVMPNIALIEEILSLGKADVCYIGSGGIEKSIVSEWKLPFYEITCPKLIRGGGFAGFKRNLTIPAAFFRAVKQAEKALKTFQPDVVFSKGGFVALPVVFAAKRLKIPCFAHESDFSAGLANRLSAGKCRMMFTSFPETSKKFRRGVYSGAPIRRAVFSSTRAEARKNLDIGFNETVVLIFGGGSGSEIINQAVRKYLKSLTERYVILHVCGKGNIVKSNLKNYRQFEFVKDMGAFYSAADLVVSRAVFEIMALKKPALFVPLEGQTRGDQLQNAEYFAKRGLCRILRQASLSRLPEAIENTEKDENLKERLKQSEFQSGNERILKELFKALQDGKNK